MRMYVSSLLFCIVQRNLFYVCKAEYIAECFKCTQHKSQGCPLAARHSQQKQDMQDPCKILLLSLIRMFKDFFFNGTCWVAMFTEQGWHKYCSRAGVYCSNIKMNKYLLSAQFHINLLKPTGHVMHQQFNIQQLYILPTLYLCVLYLSENKQRLVPLIA